MSEACSYDDALLLEILVLYSSTCSYPFENVVNQCVIGPEGFRWLTQHA